VIVPDSPDPGVLQVNNTFFAYTTSGDNSVIFPIHVSVDLVNWNTQGSVFNSSTQPSWAVSDFWAPEVHVVGVQYNVYFVARNKQGQLCVGVGSSVSPLGPFLALDSPLIQSSNISIGSIDPHLFMERMQPILYWKLDGNAIGIATVIFAQNLSDDGTQLAPGSSAQALLENTLPWEGICIEAPWVVNYDQTYYLFYSGNMYNSVGPNGTCLYSVGVSQSKGPFGPFQKFPQPILTTSSNPDPKTGLTGPGHCSVIQFIESSLPPNYYMVYHAWTPSHIGGDFSRHMAVDSLVWAEIDGLVWPTVAVSGHPNTDDQPFPS